ncbi:hypothetical protein MASR2M70_09390 [Bacillota bacterium]
MVKNKTLLFLLIFIFAVTGAALQGSISPVFAAEEAGETLTIKGDGVEKERTFSRQELEAMAEAIVRYEYSSANNFPTEKNFYRKGVTLDHILKTAGIKDDARQIKFTSSDGYSKTFTKDELLAETRYCYKEGGDKTAVPSIIAFSDSSKGFDSLSPIELCLTLGQRVKGEQNNPWFVKYLKTIEVINAEPGQWPEVSFTKSMGPEGVTVKPGHPSMDSVKIYYTLDGTNPTINSRVYNVSATYYQPGLNKAILMTKDGEIRARAIGPGKKDGPVSSAAITFGGTSFSDISDYPWAKLAIESLAEKKIINGMGNGKFAPEQSLTRAQFATIMVLAMGETHYEPGTGASAGKQAFSDVKPSDWHYGYVKKAAEKGWIKGYTDGSFRPNSPLSREEMITIAVQAADGPDLSNTEAENILEAFSKTSLLSPWAELNIAKAEKMGILEHGHFVLDTGGKLAFDAKRQASRAEAAVTVYKLLNVQN